MIPNKRSLGRMSRAATLRQLQVFDTLAKLKSFSRVAEEMHLSQPTVSMQIKKLSEVIDLPLTEQIGKEIYLTEAGQALAKLSRSIMQSLESFEECIDDLRGLEGGRVRLAVISTAQYFLPQVMQSFLAQHPQIDIVMEVVNKEHLLERLANNQDDLYILGQPPEAIPVISERLAVNPLVFVAKKDYPLPEQTQFTLNDLTELPFLMREPGSGIRAHLERVFLEMNYRPNIRMTLGSNEAIRLGVLSGLGISVISMHTVREELKRKELKILPVKGFPIERNWFLAWPKGKNLSLSANKFIETLKLHAQRVDAEIKPLLVKARKQHS